MFTSVTAQGQKMQGGVNISHLTSEPPETSIHNCNRKITPKKTCRKDVYANSILSVNISNLTSMKKSNTINITKFSAGPIVQNNQFTPNI